MLLPDEVSMVILRALAWQVRELDTDALDLWRSLEIAFRAGVKATAFASGAGPTAVKAGHDPGTGSGLRPGEVRVGTARPGWLRCRRRSMA